MNAVIIDTETTGLETNEVIELGYMPVEETGDSIQIHVAEGRVYRYKPETKMQYGAMAVHHILPDMLEDEPASATARGDVPEADYYIGHNVDYDCKALNMMHVKRIDTLPLARKLWPECDSHSQTALMYFLEGSTEVVRNKLRNAHNALADVGFCGIILEHIIRAMEIESLEHLYEESEAARIPSIMPFGEFKGEPISAVDRGWAGWYNKQADTDPYLLTALRNAGKL